MERTEIQQKIYPISEEEKKEIENLFIRKNGIRELLDSSVNNQALYEKLRDDFIEVSSKFQKWFDNFEINHEAQGAPGYFWNVNFADNTVALEKITK